MTLNDEALEKVIDYFDTNFGLRKSTKGFYRLDCVYCGGRNTAAVNDTHTGYKCFKCEAQESSLRVIMELEKLETFAAVRNFLNIGGFNSIKRLKEEANREKAPVILPPEFIPIQEPPQGILGKAAVYYMKKRGFSIDKLSKHGVGYCTSGEFAGYIIFPFYILGALKFFQGRRFAGNGPKMKNLTGSVYGVGKSELIYNMDALVMYDEVNLVESITNALTLDENTVALLGKTISPYQLSLLLGSPVECVNIILDHDAWVNALELARTLVTYVKVRLTQIPTDDDINAMGYKLSMNYIRKAKEVNYRQINKLLLDAKRTESTYNRN